MTNSASTSTKKKRVLLALCKRSYNRFESERLLSDHCLHSTVSTIQNQHGIDVCRKFEEVPGYMGTKTRVCRYWIQPENVEKALKTAKFWS
jgi:hypothetical protein